MPRTQLSFGQKLELLQDTSVFRFDGRHAFFGVRTTTRFILFVFFNNNCAGSNTALHEAVYGKGSSKNGGHKHDTYHTHAKQAWDKKYLFYKLESSFVLITSVI